MVQLIESGMIPTGSQLMENWNTSFRSAGLTWINMCKDRALTLPADGGIFVEAYVSAGGRQSSVVTADTYAQFSTNKYQANWVESLIASTYGVNYVIIEATSISGSFAINNCTITKISINEWVLGCTTGTDEVRRAQIYKTLFYGTNGTDPRASSTYITGITALKTSVVGDVGKRAYYATATTGTGGAGTATYTGTFSPSTGNSGVSSWSFLTSNNIGSLNANWEMPGSTILNSITGSSTSDETGTDRTADEKNNPATCVLFTSITNSTMLTTGRVLVLTEQPLSFVLTGTAANRTASTLDFTTTNSIPVLSAVGTIETAKEITHTIPAGTFPSDMSSSILTFDPADFEAGASVTYKLTNATEDTGWLDSNIVESFTALTAEPDELIVRLTPKTTSPTAGYPSVRGICLQAGRAIE